MDIIVTQNNPSIKRVIIYRQEFGFSPNVTVITLMFMDAISIDGGAVQNKTEYVSWDIDANIPNTTIKNALNRLGAKV